MTAQVKLEEKQLKAFNVEGYSHTQVNHLLTLLELNSAIRESYQVVDIGGGYGYFARALNNAMDWPVRIIDSDISAINFTSPSLLHNNVKAILGDALSPEIKGDEEIVCFNLILHHLIGRNESETRELQKKALIQWRSQANFLFVNEYIYESYIRHISGRLIYEITKNKTLSEIGKIIANLIPSFRANTFGVGVRFRSHEEWLELFDECGFNVASKIIGEPDTTSLPLRVLLIRDIRRDSFLLFPK